MAAAKSMKSASPAEASPDAKKRRAPQRPVTRKRTQAKPAAAEPRKRTRSPKPSARTTATPTEAPAPRRDRALFGPAFPPTVAPEAKRDRALLGPAFYLSALLVVVLAVSATAAFLLLRVDESSESLQAGVPATVSAETLATVATSRAAPVYWAGPIPSRKLELTASRTGTFVRYLPMAVLAGDPRATFTTIATYPLRNSYETAVRRGAEPGMVSREMPGGGVAVWSRAEPTSVYLAYPQKPQLVEVYALNPADARRLALSGRVRPAS